MPWDILFLAAALILRLFLRPGTLTSAVSAAGRLFSSLLISANSLSTLARSASSPVKASSSSLYVSVINASLFLYGVHLTLRNDQFNRVCFALRSEQ